MKMSDEFMNGVGTEPENTGGEPQGYNQQNYNQAGYGQPNYNPNGYGQQPYNQAPYGQPYQPRMATKSDTTGFGIASLVLGIISIFTVFCCINYILAIIAIVFGIVQIVKSSRKGLAIGGIVTAVISIVGATLFWVLVGSAGIDGTGSETFRDYMEEYMQDYMEQESDTF